MFTPFRELWNKKSKLTIGTRLSAWFFVLLAAWTLGATIFIFTNGTAYYPSIITALLGFPGLATLSATSAVNIYLLLVVVLVTGLCLFIAREILRESRRGLVYALLLVGVLLIQVVFLAVQKVLPRTLFDYAVIAAEIAVAVYLIKDEGKFKHA